MATWIQFSETDLHGMSELQLSATSNLLRSHYYFFDRPYTSDAVLFHMDGHSAYLHKEFRGFGYEHFTLKELKSLMRVFSFEFFGFRIRNLGQILRNYDSRTDEYRVRRLFNVPFLVGEEVCDRVPNPPHYFPIEMSVERDKWVYDAPQIVNVSGNKRIPEHFYPDYYRAFEARYGKGTSRVMAVVFKRFFHEELRPKLNWYRLILGNSPQSAESTVLHDFGLDMMPTIYDYKLYDSIGAYVRDVSLGVRQVVPRAMVYTEDDIVEGACTRERNQDVAD